MTKEKLILQVKFINSKLRLFNFDLNELYSKANGKLTDEEKKKEKRLIKEIAALKEEKRALLNMKVEEEKDASVVLFDEPEKSKESKEEVSEEIEEKSNNKTTANWVLGGISLALLIALITTIVKDNKKELSSNVPTSIVATATPEVALPYITPEPGMVLTDPSDNVQVALRAQYIYEKDIKPMLADMGEAANKYATPEIIENILRNSLGELSLDENGYVDYTPNTVDEKDQDRIDIFGWYPHTTESGKVYPTHYSLLAPSGTDLEMFMAEYDEVYNNIVTAINNEDIDTFRAETIKLGQLWLNDWRNQGNGATINPYRFDNEYRDLALGSAVERWEMVLEFMRSYDLTICVPNACIDHKTGEGVSVKIDDIYDALVNGATNDVTLSIYGINNPNVNQLLSYEFTQDLKEHLEFKYNEIKSLGLNK